MILPGKVDLLVGTKDKIKPSKVKENIKFPAKRHDVPIKNPRRCNRRGLLNLQFIPASAILLEATDRRTAAGFAGDRCLPSEEQARSFIPMTPNDPDL